MGDIVFTLENRRYMEPSIAYAESHDQVGGLRRCHDIWNEPRRVIVHCREE
jgi:hypothetical protein